MALIGEMCLARFFSAIGLLLTISSAEGATYFVSQTDPKSNDSSSGNEEHPWKTLTKAAESVVPGDRVLIRDGVYREQVTLKAQGTAELPIVFEAAPGAANVVLTGADRITGWKQSDSSRPVYHVAWPRRFIPWSKHMTHPDDDHHRLIGRCEQVIIDNYLLRQVLENEQLAPGAFWVDVSNQVLYAWDSANRDLNKCSVEASVRQVILHVEGSHVLVRGLRFRHAANMAQQGAVVLAGDHDQLEDCVMECMNSSGATFAAPGQVVRRCVFRDNGQLGFGANGAHGLLFSDCLVENNNTKGFDRGWEAGGDKLVLCRDAVLEQSRFVRNRGNGIWFDIGNENCSVRHCLIAENEDSGIFCEISYGLQAHDNVITGNGFATTAGAWGAQAGLVLSSSPGCHVERNLIIGNREGFNFREQTRTTPRIGNKEEEPIWNHDEEIGHNVIAFNRDAQVWGWFDMKEGWHWPADKASQNVTNHCLESLKLSFKQNAYFATAGQGWFRWGVTWGRHKTYDTLKAFQEDLGIDTQSRVVDPEFLNAKACDFRISPKRLKELAEDYPQGSIPMTLLGLNP